MSAEGIVELQQQREHRSAFAGSGPWCRIAPLTGRRRTTSVSAFPKLSRILLLPKPPKVQSTVSAGKEAIPSVTALGHLARRKKVQNRSRLALLGPTGKCCAQRAPEEFQIHRCESLQSKYGSR